MFRNVLKNMAILIFASSLMFANNYDLKNVGVSVEIDEKIVSIKRIDNEECLLVSGGKPENLFSGNYAKDDLPKSCVKKFLTTMGKITPMKINDKIETIGELEVIEFIENSQTDKNKLLIDARLPSWFLEFSIPTAENIPFTYFDKNKYPDDFYDVLEMIGVKEVSKGKYDFSKAKELVLFCNGAWCPQSTFAIENLIKIGYPQKKMKWYRGGIYSWKLLNLTTISE